jgi:hypothetical protein
MSSTLKLPDWEIELSKVPLPFVIAISLAVIFLVHRVFFYDARRKHLPPGPRGWPLIGNSFQIDLLNNPEIKLIEWAKKHGEIYYLRLGSSDFVFLNSGRVVKDLLDKRGSIYSDKPYLPMAGEAYTKGLNLALMQYNQRWKVISLPAYLIIDTSTIDAGYVDTTSSRNIPSNPTIRISTNGSRLA